MKQNDKPRLSRADFLSRQDIAELAGVKIETVYAWNRQGKITFNPLGLIHVDDFMQQMKRNTTEPNNGGC